MQKLGSMVTIALLALCLFPRGGGRKPIFR
jgi:hypothetical protein